LADDVDSFGKYVSHYKTEIALKAGEGKREYATILYPKELDLV
jgi:hypothetical protein